MPTPSGLPTQQDLKNCTLDVAHAGRVFNSKDAQGNPITTSTNRTGGVNKTLDALEAEFQHAIDSAASFTDTPNPTFTTNDGQTKRSVSGLISDTLEAIRNAGGQPLGDGTWQAGQTFTAYNQFMVYNGIAYKPLTTTTLPYGTTGATPDLAFVGPFDANDHSKLNNRDEAGAHPASAIDGISTMRNDLLGGIVFPPEPEKELQLGDIIPAGVTHVRLQGGIRPLTPQVSGVVSSIGDRSIVVNGVEVFHFVVRGDTLYYGESGGKMDATLDQEFWDATVKYARDVGVKIKLGNGQLLLNRFRVNNNTVIGSLTTEILLQYSPAYSAVLGQIQSNSRLKWLTIRSLESDLEWQRCTFEGAEDVTCDWVNFVGFKHLSSRPNAWGAYFSNSKRCTLTDCGFDDNSQADFAIVDTNEFISIIRPRKLGNRLVGNIEPNSLTPNTQIKVAGAKLDIMYMFTNTRIGDPMNRITLEDSEVDRFYYDGADVTLINTAINEWVESRNASNTIFAGNIDVVGGNFSFSRNLVTDKNFAIAAAAASGAEWVIQFSSSVPTRRLELLSNNHERGLILNPFRENAQTILTTLHPIAVTPSSMYMIGLTAKVDTGASWIGGFLNVRELDGNGQLLRVTTIITHRELEQSTKDTTTNFAVFKTLAQTSSVKIELTNANGGVSTSRLTVKAISLNRLEKGDVDFTGIKNEHVPVKNVVVRGASVYKTELNYRVPMLVGDEVYVGADHYICTDASVRNGVHWIGGWGKYNISPA